MKNFEENPERFLVDVDEGLERVFKKSVESIIRTARVVEVKDWEIRDSTDLLEGFKGDDWRVCEENGDFLDSIWLKLLRNLILRTKELTGLYCLFLIHFDQTQEFFSENKIKEIKTINKKANMNYLIIIIFHIING